MGESVLARPVGWPRSAALHPSYERTGQVERELDRAEEDITVALAAASFRALRGGRGWEQGTEEAVDVPDKKSPGRRDHLS